MGRALRYRRRVSSFIHRAHVRETTTAFVRAALAVESLEPRQLLAGDLVINEFMASNSSSLADEDGDFTDWVEIRNVSAGAVDLAGWYLTDDAADLTKWQFPSVTVNANDYLVLFASSKGSSRRGQ